MQEARELALDHFIEIPEPVIFHEIGVIAGQFEVARVGERGAAILLASEYRVDMATLATRLKELGLVEGNVVSLVRNCRTTQADIIELNLYVPLEELEGTTVPRPFARAVLRL